MKIINQKNDQITFQVELETSLANAIRRCVNKIPVIAIDEVEILKNDSPLYDETLAHRIGLIPLENSRISGKKQEVISLKLDTKKEGIVFSGDIEGKIKVPYDKIPIISLNKGQGLKLTANTKIGTGIEHSKFSPGMIFYRDIVNIKINNDCPSEVIETCPQKILKQEGNKIISKEDFKCDLCESCVEFCKKQGKEYITLSPTKELMMTIESFGHLDFKNIFSKSIDILKKDIAEFSKKISK